MANGDDTVQVFRIDEPASSNALRFMPDTLSVEATLGQIQGTYSGTDFWHINVMAEPWSDQRISPFFTIGVGKLVGSIEAGKEADFVVLDPRATPALAQWHR